MVRALHACTLIDGRAVQETPSGIVGAWLGANKGSEWRKAKKTQGRIRRRTAVSIVGFRQFGLVHPFADLGSDRLKFSAETGRASCH